MSRVMLAEDDQSMLFLLKTLLTMDGYEVITLNVYSEDIVNAVRRDMPDVLLMDVHLAKKNGLEILRNLRSDASLNDVIVVMCSGMNLQLECIEAGANSFLLKPYMPDDLLGSIRKNLLARAP